MCCIALSLPTLKLIEVESDIPSVKQQKVLPRLPTASRPTTRCVVRGRLQSDFATLNIVMTLSPDPSPPP